MKSIYLAGGCFWGIQKYMDQFHGVLNTTVGYANGNTKNPSYEDVKSQKSGHAETVEIIYDDTVIALHKILEYFYQVIDPTSINKQGGDEGISYRTGIYYVKEVDIETIHNVTQKIQKQYEKPMVVEIEMLDNFYPAEEYHQKYLEKNPEGYCHVDGCLLNLGETSNDLNR
jgi:methionine-S-sulfoxide reductase